MGLRHREAAARLHLRPEEIGQPHRAGRGGMEAVIRDILGVSDQVGLIEVDQDGAIPRDRRTDRRVPLHRL